MNVSFKMCSNIIFRCYHKYYQKIQSNFFKKSCSFMMCVRVYQETLCLATNALHTRYTHIHTIVKIMNYKYLKNAFNTHARTQCIYI